jgi:alkaline phosphatase
MQKKPNYISQDSIAKYYNIQTTPDFLNTLKIFAEQTLTDTIQYLLGTNFSLQNHIGWTTTKHTGDDVPLYIYAPDKVKKKTGLIDNSSIGKYIAEVLHLENFDYAADRFYCKHTHLFDDAIATPSYLTVEKNGKKIMVYPNTNIIKYNETIMLTMSSISIYINGYYYLPVSILRYLD